MTGHVQVTSWNSWCQRQGQSWGVPCHSQDGPPRLGTPGAGTRRGCLQGLWGAGSDAAEHMNSWKLLSLCHVCIQKQELNQLSLPSAGRPGAIHTISHWTNPAGTPQLPPQHTLYSVLSCEQFTAQTRTASPPQLAATHPKRKDKLGMRTPQSFGLPRNKQFSAWKPQDAFWWSNIDFHEVIEQEAAAVLAAIPKLEASHLTTQGVTMEASCTVLVLERTTENSIYYITLY